jgi:hypothetical protein
MAGRLLLNRLEQALTHFNFASTAKPGQNNSANIAAPSSSPVAKNPRDDENRKSCP